MRGAVILFSLLNFFSSSTQSNPLKLPGSRMVVMPCAIHSLKTYSAGVPCSTPPICPCISIKPGNRYIPSAFSSLPPSFNCGRRLASMGTPGAPTFTILAIRLFSTTISTGPIGGAPVLLIKITPRMMSCGHGPSPSFAKGALGI